MSTTPNRGLQLVPEGVIDFEAAVNLTFNQLDAIVQARVKSFLDYPPVSNQDGDCYIVGTGTGDWTGLDDNLVRYVAEGDFWQAYAPGQINFFLNDADGEVYKWDTTASPGEWVTITGGGGGGVLVASDADSPPTEETNPCTRLIFGAGLIFTDMGSGRGLVEGVGAGPPTVVNSAAANIDADETNSGNYTRFSHASPTYTFDDAESYVIGAEYHGRYVGSGTLMITEAGGMTVNPPTDGTLEIPIGGTFTVKIVASDEADLIGVTVPV